jgi:large subunit ribosomal protein L22
VREVLDLIRNQPVERAQEILRFCERGAAATVAKVLGSAVANASENDDLKNPEELYVSACFADEAKTMRRMRPRARGRATRIRKRSAHITIIVSRMPEDRLRRVRARQEVEQAARRARRAASRAGTERARGRRRAGRAADAEPEAPGTVEGAEVEAVDERAAEEPPAEEAPIEEPEQPEEEG